MDSIKEEKQVKITEGNKLIAEFMQLEKCFAHEKDEFGYTQTVDGFKLDEFTQPITVKQLKYNSSWDWLMPVVEKIESLDFRFPIELSGCMICIKNLKEDSVLIEYIESENKINAVYMAVIKFVEWYNKQK